MKLKITKLVGTFLFILSAACRKATISERSELLTPSGVGSSHGTETPVLLVGGTSPAGGTDVCSISTKSIESYKLFIISFLLNIMISHCKCWHMLF